MKPNRTRKFYTPDGRHMFTETYSTRMLLKPVVAQEMISKMFKLDCQRDIKQDWVNLLASEFTTYSRRTPTIVLGTLDSGITAPQLSSRKESKWVVADGHHTLLAIVKADVTVEVWVSWNECCGEEGMHYLYMTCDSNMPKTIAAGIKAYIGKFREPGMNRCSVGMLKSCATALAAVNGNGDPSFYGVRKYTKAVDYTIRLLEKHAVDVLFVAEVARSRHMHRVAVMAAIIMTSRINESVSREFWTSVCSGAGFGRQDPRLRLRDKLKLSGHRGKAGKEMADGYYKDCVAAWEAYLRYRVKLR
jgi:hypothetical protein